jgi:hypothetical protein
MASDKVVLGPAFRLVIPSSFVATIDSKNFKHPFSLHSGDEYRDEYRIGRGGWIIQAKATVRDMAADWSEVQVHLKATADTMTVEDRGYAYVPNLHFTTAVAVLGINVPHNALVEVRFTLAGKAADLSQPARAEVSHIVVTGIHQDELVMISG